MAVAPLKRAAIGHVVLTTFEVGMMVMMMMMMMMMMLMMMVMTTR